MLRTVILAKNLLRLLRVISLSRLVNKNLLKAAYAYRHAWMLGKDCVNQKSPFPGIYMNVVLMMPGLDASVPKVMPRCLAAIQLRP